MMQLYKFWARYAQLNEEGYTITVLATDITDDITDEVDNADENSY